MFGITERLVLFMKYGISKSFRYNLDCGSLMLWQPLDTKSENYTR